MSKIGIKKIYFFYVLIFLLPIMIYMNIGVKFNVSLADFLLPMIILSIFIDSRTYKIKYIDRFIAIKYIYIIIVILLLSLFKVNLKYGVSNFISSSINVVKILINIGYFLVFIYMFSYYHEKFEKIFLRAWNYSLFMVNFMCILGVILYNLGIENNWTYSYRATGPFEDPNLAATYLLISISICIIYNYTKNKKIISYNVILCIVSIFLTASRAAIIILIFSSLITIISVVLKQDIWILKKILKIIINVTIISIILLIIFNFFNEFNFFQDTFSRLTHESKNIMEDSRITKWINAIKVWAHEPIFGSGIGMYIDRKIMLGLGNDRIVAHNTYLSILAELGIIGAISFFWLPIKLFINLYKPHSKFNVIYSALIFSMTSLFISQASLNLENFRCMWVYYAFVYYLISKENNKKALLIRYNDNCCQ